jgi:hypothetical protein
VFRSVDLGYRTTSEGWHHRETLGEKSPHPKAGIAKEQALEPRIYKVVVMYRNLSAREAVTIYVLAFSGEEAEKRATDAMSLISGQNRKLIAMEYLVDRTVNWIAISSHDGVIAEG